MPTVIRRSVYLTGIALGLALATSIWNGNYEVHAVVCPRPVDQRCMRHIKTARRNERALSKWRKHRRRHIRGWQGWLSSTRSCESHSNYRINTGNGYYGAYQFSLSTWGAVGGKGFPHQNPKLEQDFRAVVLATTGGTGHWPNCG